MRRHTLGLRYAHAIALAPSSAGRGALSLPISVCMAVEPGQFLMLTLRKLRLSSRSSSYAPL